MQNPKQLYCNLKAQLVWPLYRDMTGAGFSIGSAWYIAHHLVAGNTEAVLRYLRTHKAE